MTTEYVTENARTKKELLGGIVTDASFERLRLTKVTISVPNGRKYHIVADDGVLICTRVI